MKVKIVILPNGQIEFFTQEGTFENGVTKLQKLTAALGAAGLKIAKIDQPEQHRHDGTDHVHAHVHA